MEETKLRQQSKDREAQGKRRTQPTQEREAKAKGKQTMTKFRTPENSHLTSYYYSHNKMKETPQQTKNLASLQMTIGMKYTSKDGIKEKPLARIRYITPAQSI